MWCAFADCHRYIALRIDFRSKALQLPGNLNGKLLVIARYRGGLNEFTKIIHKRRLSTAHLCRTIYEANHQKMDYDKPSHASVHVFSVSQLLSATYRLHQH